MLKKAVALLLVLAAPTAYASDPTPLIQSMYLALGLVFVIFVIAVWTATRKLKNTRWKTLLWILPFSVCWTFVPAGQSTHYWWPALFVLLIGEPVEKVMAVVVMVATTILAFVVCWFFVWASRPDSKVHGDDS